METLARIIVLCLLLSGPLLYGQNSCAQNMTNTEDSEQPQQIDEGDEVKSKPRKESEEQDVVIEIEPMPQFPMGHGVGVTEPSVCPLGCNGACNHVLIPGPRRRSLYPGGDPTGWYMINWDNQPAPSQRDRMYAKVASTLIDGLITAMTISMTPMGMFFSGVSWGIDRILSAAATVSQAMPEPESESEPESEPEIEAEPDPDGITELSIAEKAGFPELAENLSLSVLTLEHLAGLLCWIEESGGTPEDYSSELEELTSTGESHAVAAFQSWAVGHLNRPVEVSANELSLTHLFPKLVGGRWIFLSSDGRAAFGLISVAGGYLVILPPRLMVYKLDSWTMNELVYTINDIVFPNSLLGQSWYVYGYCPRSDSSE